MRAPDEDRSRAGKAHAAPPGWCLRWVACAQGEPGLVVDRPDHAHTSVVYILSGIGTLTIAGSETTLGAGDAFILPQGMDHRLVYDDRDPWRMLFIGCSGVFPAQLRTAYGIEGIYAFRDAPIAQPIRNLLGFDGDDAALQLYAGQILADIMRILHTSVQDQPDWPPLVIRAKAFIDAHLEGGLRLAEVARHVGCSPAHLSRNFRQCVGMPPGDYLLSRRMSLAKTLLDTSDLSIKAIASRLGYGDTFSFSHAFKLAVGTSPSLWRMAQHGP